MLRSMAFRAASRGIVRPRRLPRLTDRTFFGLNTSPKVQNPLATFSLTPLFAKEPPNSLKDFFPPGSHGKIPDKREEPKPESSSAFNSNEDKKGGSSPPPPLNDDSANLPGLLALLALVVTLRHFLEQDEDPKDLVEIAFADFRRMLDAGIVQELRVVNQNRAHVVFKKERAASKDAFEQEHEKEFGMETTDSTQAIDTHKQYYFYIGTVDVLEEKLTKAQNDKLPTEWIGVTYRNQTNYFTEALRFVPMLTVVAALHFGLRSLTRGAGGAGGGSIFGMGRSNAKQIKPESVGVSFADVAGCQQAKQEIMEFVDFLQDSSRFTELGAKIPKGALLVRHRCHERMKLTHLHSVRTTRNRQDLAGQGSGRGSRSTLL